MRRPDDYALEAAKEIVIAKMQSSASDPSGESGRAVGEFFQEIYTKIHEIALQTDDSLQPRQP